MKKLLILTAALMLLYTQLYAGNGDLIVNGNLGVGTSAPNYKLDIEGAPAPASGFSGYSGTTPSGYIWPNGYAPEAIFTRPNTGVIGGVGGQLTYRGGIGLGPGVGIYSVNPNPAGSPYYGDIRFHTTWWDGGNYRNSDRMVIEQSGNVGIGMTTPGTKLDVLAGSASSWMAQFQGNSPNGGYFTIHDAHNSATRGFVGYGGTLFSSNQISDFGLRSQGNLAFATNGGYTRMYIDTSGYVGIGTTTPAYSLDVAGTIRANNVSPSDIRFKKDILPVDAPLTKLLSLNGVSYQWKTDEYKDKGFPEGRHYGVIAQEIEKVLPEVVNTAPDGTKSVAYTEIIPVLIEAMKAQQKEMDKQNSEINDLKELVKQLTSKK